MASSSSRGYVSRYDVFLSFRGEDTRDSFTDHLYQALRRAGVYTFRDNDSISRGEDLQPSIVEGIRESRASIIVLSAKYATSRWCLDELCLILDQRKERDHFVLPIFYHVDPSHIKKQEGTFQINVVPNTKWTDDNVKRWKAALEKVGQITGKVATSGPETIFLREVVDIIKERLDLKQVYCQGNLVGMETRDKEINSWLEQSDSDIFAIWGMPGSGKTTLARHIVYSNWHKFESVSILQDIGSRSTEQLRQLQEKLIIDIIEGKERTIPSVWHGTYTIEDALQRKKALIVLDNIVAERQLATFLGTGTKTQSKIIITTRERNSSKWFQSTSWRCQEHEMKLLDDRDSFELLSLYAFEPNAPIIGYEELIKRALVYCRGNPLALEVLGSSLNRGSQQFWESKLTSYEREVPGDLKSVLITSYNLLQQNIQKQLFLHIACFFIGEDKDYVEKILGPDYCAKSEIVNLTNSCLLSVSPNNKLMMHQLLQAVARTIVDDESHTHPGNRSRVWRDGESHNVLIKEKGSTNVKGLALDMEVLGKQRLALGKKQLSDVVNTKSFEKMDSLQLLKLNQLKLTGTYQNIFKELRWLCWREFLLEAIPPELDMENLVAIDMSRSKLKVFQPPDVLPLLQILNLTDSRNLVEVQDISRVPKLDTLVLENCRSLVHVCHTLRDLTSLTSLNLTGCENLFNRMQPQFIFPNSLKQLFLMDCNVNTHFSSPTYSFSIQPHLEYLNLAVNPCELLPSYTHLKNIRVLDLSSCTALKKLRCLPSKLRELYIFNCNSLETVTFESHKFTLQEFRYEGCVNLSEVEDFFKIVPVATLTESDLGHMNWLRTYQDLEVCLVGDNDITKGRTLCLQMLYEFNIMSISLPDIEKPNMIPENEYTSEDPLLSFDIPESHRNRKLRGLTLTFKYTLQGEEWVWFAKIRTNNGVNLIYNAKVFGKPAADESGIWLSYWPIGESLHVGDEVNVSIIVTKGLEINGCGASLVYAGEEDEDESFEDSNKSILENHEFFEDVNDFFEDANDFFEDNNQHADILGGDISGFKLSKGTYYLCRRDYSQLMEVGRLTPNWFRDLVGDTIDYTEIGGWRKTGRRTQPYRSYAKLKTDRCIIYGPHLEELYKIEELSKSSLSDETEEYTSEFSTNATKMEIGQMPKSQTHELDNARSKVERDTTEIELSREDIDQHYGKTTEKAAEELGAMLAATGYVKEPEPSTSSSVQLSPQCCHFQLFDILLATENFDESLVIGKGGFGKVYKGTIFNGSANVLAAIKRLDRSSNQGAPEFWAEVEMLSKLRHCNLVSLFGYCNDEDEMVLVYEYMPNGTLEDHLHRLGTPLSWVQRLQICIGAGRGLHFLHTGTGIDVGVIHSDVKTSNILLQESWAAKISDFGLSQIGPTNQTMTHVSTLVKGTFGYVDPDYFVTGKLTRKSDVYSFGVVLLEVLCRKRAVFDIDKQAFNLAIWAQESIKEGNLKNIIDPDLKGQIYSKCLKEFVRITERCLHSSPKRSTMVEVLYSLESILSLQEKFNNSVQPAGRTILDRMVNMLPFPFKKENTAQGDSKSSSEGKSRIGTNTVGAGNNTFLDTSELPADYKTRSLKEFEYDDLRKVTKNFSPERLLGEGGFGKVYLGWVDQNMFAPSKHGVGVPVAVKRLNQESIQGHSEWQAEVSFLGRLAHPNIISLLGYCSNEHERLLVYEYMENKSFDGFLFTDRPNAPNTAEPLSWGTRLIIMMGVARGLVYLHSSQNQVMCRGVKAADILLDKDFTAKLGDFGLVRCSPKIGESHVTTRVMGTFGYVAPEYIETGHLYVKSDIYSFGVVLLETLTGLRVLDFKRPIEKHNLVEWARPILGKKRKLKTIMDPRLEQNYPLEGAFKCAALALRCLENQPKDRPSSEEVLQSLEEIMCC